MDQQGGDPRMDIINKTVRHGGDNKDTLCPNKGARGRNEHKKGADLKRYLLC